RSGALLVSYNNDDAFRPQGLGQDPSHYRRLWKYYLETIPDYDLHFVYRKVNVAELKAAGAKEAHILMPYFVPTLHHPVTLTQEEKGKYACEVVFVGHYEPDGRVEHLNALIEAGINVKLFGSEYWNRRILDPVADYFGEVHAVLGTEYTKALCGAQICLNFLSRLNRDTYTRRCFEIPACGRLLLSERTPDLLSLFRENEEAVYFSSPSELVERVLWLQARPELIQTIAEAGHRRVLCEDHTVDGRMKWVVELLAKRIHKQGAVGLV
ncbi:MAG: CgeB family protein, partial [Planctomycetota bacterium]